MVLAARQPGHAGCSCRMTMRTRKSEPPRLGDLIADAFDSASRYTSNPREVALLATEAIDRLLRGTSGNGRVRLAERRGGSA